MDNADIIVRPLSREVVLERLLDGLWYGYLTVLHQEHTDERLGALQASVRGGLAAFATLGMTPACVGVSVESLGSGMGFTTKVQWADGKTTHVEWRAQSYAAQECK